MSAVHRVVLATVRKSLATAQLRAEELRSQRDSMATISKGQQSAAIALGKRLREADRIAESWSLVQVAILAAALSEDDDDADEGGTRNMVVAPMSDPYPFPDDPGE